MSTDAIEQAVSALEAANQALTTAVQTSNSASVDATSAANAAADAANQASANLDSSKSLVPAANKIPQADAGGKIATDWLSGEVPRTADLINTANPAKGSGMSGHNDALAYASGTAGKAIKDRVIASDLASASDAAKGAGLAGYSDSLTYTGGTAGAAIKARAISADLANASDPAKGAALNGYDGGTVADVLNTVKPLTDYTVLRAYTGPASIVRITSNGLAGDFKRDPSDTTSADNSGTIIVDGLGRRWKRTDAHLINIRWFGAKGDGVTDDFDSILAAINALPSSGGEILFPPSYEFCVRSGLPIGSNTTVVGVGSKISVTDSGFSVTDPEMHLFHNENYGSVSIIDENIKIIGIETNYKTVTPGHSVGFKKARNVEVLFCKLYGGSNGTTFRACENTKVIGCDAKNQTNCCYDHWDATGDVIVTSNHADSALADQGIQITGDGDYPPGPSVGTSVNAVVTSNIVKNIGASTGTPSGASGIILNSIQSGSKVVGGSIVSNIVNSCGLGIVLSGAISGIAISANDIKNSLNRSIQLGANSASENPSNCSVTGNTVCSSAAGTTSPYSLDGTGHTFSGNTCDGIGGYGYALKLLASSCVIGLNNLPAGSAGVIESLGSSNRLELSLTYTPSLTFGGGSTGITYTSRSAKAELMGKLMFVEISIVLSSKGTSTGSAQLSMPSGYTAAAECFVGVAGAANFQSGVTGLTGGISSGSSLINIRKQGASGLTSAADTDFANNTNITLSGTVLIN